MLHLKKLATAIKLASRIRNADEFLAESMFTPKKTKKTKNTSNSSSPTEEEQRNSERGVSFGESLDLSTEPSTEYLH